MNPDRTQIALELPTYGEHSWAEYYTTMLCDLRDGKIYPQQIIPKAKSSTFSPDGKLIAVISQQHLAFDYQLKIWDVKTKKFILTTNLTDRATYGKMQFSPNGRILHISLTNWQSFPDSKMTILTYSLESNQITQRAELDAYFMQTYTIDDLLTDGTCLVTSWDTEPCLEIPEGQKKTNERELLIYNPHTKTFIKLLDFQERHICGIDYIPEKHQLRLSDHNGAFQIMDMTTREIIETKGEFKKNSDDSDSESDDEVNDSDSDSDDEDNIHPNWASQFESNIGHAYTVTSLYDGSVEFTRQESLNFDINKRPVTFNPKLLPFVDWLYTTQKTRDFKPLTLTKEGWQLFKQLDEFSQVALTRNLKLLPPREQQPILPQDYVKRDTKPVFCSIM